MVLRWQKTSPSPNRPPPPDVQFLKFTAGPPKYYEGFIIPLWSTFKVRLLNSKKQRACTQCVLLGLAEYRPEADFSLGGGNVSISWSKWLISVPRQGLTVAQIEQDKTWSLSKKKPKHIKLISNLSLLIIKNCSMIHLHESALCSYLKSVNHSMTFCFTTCILWCKKSNRAQ